MSKTPSSIWRDPVHFTAFGFGSGAAPMAPGTFGTAMAVLLYLLLPPMSALVYGLFLVFTFAIGVWVCDKTSRDIGVHDHGGIVWDEFVGYWICMFLAPTGWQWLLLGFVLFRLFDIVKPWPIRWLDSNVSGGFGIMIDDVLAGVMAFLVIQVFAFIV